MTGGLFHALAGNFAPPVQSSWWLLTLALVCGVSLAMDFSLLHVVFGSGLGGFWRAAVVLKFIAFVLLAIVEGQYWAAIASYAPSLLAWAAAAIVRPYSWRGWMLAGIGLSVLAAIVQVRHLSALLNYNDRYHIIQTVALFGLYRAGLLFGRISGSGATGASTSGTET